MDWFESLRKMLPWLQSLPTLAKIIVSLIVILFATLMLVLLWVPPTAKDPSKDPAVIETYSRMSRVLSRIDSINGKIVVDGVEVPNQLTSYYKPFVAISAFVRQHPGDIKGAAEIVFEHGGTGRVFINDTQEFESVVRDFSQAFENARLGLDRGPKSQ